MFLFEEKAMNYALKACQYEYLLNGTNSIWCKYFDKDLLKLLEYREDLKYNCKYSYKYELSRLMTCDLVSDLLKKLDEMQTNDSKRAIIYFVDDSSTMLSFLASMGLNYAADSFNLDNIVDINENRAYKTSRMDPMNSNIAFVLYECPTAGSKRKSHKIRAFHNEKLIKLNNCEDCDLSDFRRQVESSLLQKCKNSRQVCSSNLI